MYGLVNQAVRKLILHEHGPETWATIRRQAGCEDDDFVTMHPYPDELTYALVEAASAVLGAPPEAILREFGRYWVRFAAETAYGHLMKAAGNSVRDFLANLDHLHARVGLSFPELRPPQFRVIPEGPDQIRLQYFSERAGLAPFVIGLVEGLGQRFHESIQVSLATPRDQDHACDEFLVTFAASASG